MFFMKNKAILCVDDEMIILLSLVQELKSAFGNKFIYEQALNANDALKAIEDLSRDEIRVVLIISDWLMPGLTGDEFLEKVHTKYPQIKAIMVTGNADDEMINRVRGFDYILAVLKKPWSDAELRRIIASAFQDGPSA